MHALWFMLLALCALAIAYRFYAAFIAAKVLALDDSRTTAAHLHDDGDNYHPTHRVVLFGHHFAAITGAGPLVGPVLAAQFGFLPGYSWILIGVCLGGAVHDLIMLTASVRRGGKSLAEIARLELGPVAGVVAAVAILFIIVVALAGLGRVVVGALSESAWGVFAIGVSIPLALVMGIWMKMVRGGSVRGIREASIVGVVVLLAAVVLGKQVQDSWLGAHLKLDETELIVAIAAYGFLASVLPVWLLLCPRDYLSSYMKIGTIGLLVMGVMIVNPAIEMPMFTVVTAGAISIDGAAYLPVVKGSLFPFVFITIACGAISGFHALIATGTTPKMINRERDCRPIGYGAMLMEGLVGVTALLAACALPPADYFAINTNPPVPLVAVDGVGLWRDEQEYQATVAALSDTDRQRLGISNWSSLGGKTVPLSEVMRMPNRALAAAGFHVDVGDPHAQELSTADFARLGIRVDELPALSMAADEVVAGRTGGAVSLAVGMARVFANLPIPGMKSLLSYWYHFAIMFEALFVLTTIDTGTRVGRFLLQEFVGRRWRRFGDPSWLPGSVVATSIIVAAWSLLIATGSIATIWPMFGIANQLLASVALVVGTTIVLKEASKRRYVLVTLVPLSFVATMTLWAGSQALWQFYWPTRHTPIGLACTVVTSVLLVCVVLILIIGGRTWWRLWHRP
jgi:carbon starvation protein